MTAVQHPMRHRRARLALGLVFLALAALGSGFFRAQVSHSPAYGANATDGRVRALPVPAPRGLIVDRYGAVLAENVSAYAVSLLPASPDSIRRALVTLAPHLELSERDVASLLERHERAPRRPLLIARDAPFHVVSMLEERRPWLPGVVVEVWPLRSYPAGSATAHLVGVLGEGDRGAGASGVESHYQDRLAGADGVRLVTVDRAGRVLRSLALEQSVPAVAGGRIRLSVDRALQEWIAASIPADAPAAVVALEPGTGAIRALYSSPAYDPNHLTGHEFAPRWAALRDAPPAPLLDRAVAGSYPPGGIWQVVSAVVALELGVVSPETVMPLICRGGMRYGDRYLRCSDSRGHGSLDLTDAVAQGCDVYFFQLGLKLGLRRLVSEGARLGFGRPTGVDLPAERPGLFPREPRRDRAPGMEGDHDLDALLLAAGRASMRVSPLAVAHFLAGVSTGGSTPAPRVLAEAGPGGATAPGAWKLGARSREAVLDALARVEQPESWDHSPATAGWAWRGLAARGTGPDGVAADWFVGMAGVDGAVADVVVVVVADADGVVDPARIAAGLAELHLRRRQALDPGAAAP